MKRTIILVAAITLYLVNTDGVFAQYWDAGRPVAFVNGCDLDLNKDGNTDTALLVHSNKGYELIAILRFEESVKAYILNRSDGMRRLTCKYASQIKETDAVLGEGKGRVFKIDREFITLLQPESSEVAYVWLDGEFKEVWLSD